MKTKKQMGLRFWDIWTTPKKKNREKSQNPSPKTSFENIYKETFIELEIFVIK